MPLKSPGGGKASFAKSDRKKMVGPGLFGGGLAGGRKGGGGSGEEAHGILEGISSLHSWIKTQTMIRPHPKMTRTKMVSGLFDEDQDEDVVITLTAKNPQASRNVVRFDWSIMEWVSIKLMETMIDHLEIESTCLHKDSSEAKRQIQKDGGARDGYFKRFTMNIITKERVKSALTVGLEEDDDNEDDDETAVVSPEIKKPPPKGKPSKKPPSRAAPRKRRDSDDDDDNGQEKKLQNQFSFVERAQQKSFFTKKLIYTSQSHEMQTEPPPRANFSDTVNQWIIYDAYTNYERVKELQEEMEKIKGKKETAASAASAASATVAADSTSSTFNIRRKLLGEKKVDVHEDLNKKLLKAAKILERMVNQNTYNDIALDFKYWEDASDEFRDTEGTLLPLWKFSFEQAKGMEITGLCWNPAYQDLFAAAYGSYNFYEQDNGTPSYVCVYSLKNPSYPEYLCHAHCGVLCVDIHPKHPHMLAAGMADGSVAVYNMQLQNMQEPTYISTAKNGKHRDIVWQVKWAPDNLDGYLNFYSVSGDGRVTNWTIVKTALWYTDIMVITFSKHLENFSEEAVRENIREGGRCVTFNPTDDMMFLVGTDEGFIYKCTTEYSSRFLQTYPAHNTPIYNIAWNQYVPTVFLTCAAEWMIKIWDHNATKPLFMFDLNAQVGDVAWAPYSSTVFAAVTVDGKVHVFDLHVDKYHPICSQPIVPRKKARLNHVSFNAHHPIIIVGDSRGTIHCLKLSPNLRKQTKEVRVALANKEPKRALELETKKMESLLAMVREPDVENKKNKMAADAEDD